MSQHHSLLDINALNKYLRDAQVSIGEIVSAEKFSGGQSNPTFKISSADADYVLRRQPPGELLKSAHAVDREYRVISALSETDVPVPEAIHLCTDTQVLGAMFYIMEFKAGRIFWKSALPEIESNTQRGAMYDEMNRVMAALHSVDVDAVGLSDYGKPGNYFERQLQRWTKQYRASETERIDDIERLITWLEASLPDDDGQVSLVHGDFRLDNMMFAEDASDVVAVLDWELSTLGHPFADLAYQCMQLRLPHNMGHAPGLGGLDREALGIPSEEDYVNQYCERRGIAAIDNWSFYLAFSFFRLAAIVQGVVKRAQQGNASNAKASSLAAMMKPLAAHAVTLID
ncbi:phosphotransferase family protein [Alteromonas oceanisediminis]|uniref:phosphotransferase family protein n=1 Tax=Alteromonas oceanisediminis TaxID=2836180 RepID=UPI001BDA0C27|nr:phosphotransferase family protein [Alteromonas oceanisediminis]MBT0587328.1 phosphotransferase family protein [Alteromonas oceanisediminis]